MEVIEFDSQGRVKFDPIIHFAHGKRMTEEEIEYLCKYCDIDGTKAIAYALGKTETAVADKIHTLKKDGRFEYYKNLNKHW